MACLFFLLSRTSFCEGVGEIPIWSFRRKWIPQRSYLPCELQGKWRTETYFVYQFATTRILVRTRKNYDCFWNTYMPPHGSWVHECVTPIDPINLCVLILTRLRTLGLCVFYWMCVCVFCSFGKDCGWFHLVNDSLPILRQQSWRIHVRIKD